MSHTDYWNLTYFLESNIFVNLEPVVCAYFDLLVGCLALALAADQSTNAQESHYTNASQTAGESHHEIVCDNVTSTVTTEVWYWYRTH